MSCNVPYHAVPYHAVPYHAVPYHAVPYHAVPYYVVEYRQVTDDHDGDLCPIHIAASQPDEEVG